MNSVSILTFLGEDDTEVEVVFNLLYDEDDFEVDFDSLEVLFKGVNIKPTLDSKDLDKIERDIYDKWDEVVKEFRDALTNSFCD